MGGNVVVYFCTPQLEILHAVWGPESPQEFLRQATWAVEQAKELNRADPRERAAQARANYERNPYRECKGPLSWTTAHHYYRCDRLREWILAPLADSATELFKLLVNERVIDKEEEATSSLPSCRRP